MKTLALASLLVFASAAQAASKVILDVTVPALQRGANVDTSFQMNTETLEGSVLVIASHIEYQYQGGWGPYPQPYPGPIGCDPRFGCSGPWGGGWSGNRIPVQVTDYKEWVKVAGLRLEGTRVIYDGGEGQVDCGYLGTSTVFKRPTIYLSGNCTTSSNIGPGGRLTVTLTTK